MIPFDMARQRPGAPHALANRRRARPLRAAPDRSTGPRPSWLIGDAEIAATGADYVALGHWNRAARVGNGAVPAYYSGSPEYAGTVNVVRMSEAGRRDGDARAARYRARADRLTV